jgi:hypothetical protein
MALDIAADKHALHATSKSITDIIKCTAKSVTNGLWEFPRYATATSKESEPIIPSPSIFKPLLNQSDNANRNRSSVAAENVNALPSAAECAVHLEFLETLFVLRQGILRSEDLDSVFDTKPVYKYVNRRGTQTRLKDDTLWKRRQVKWEKFVAFAVARFLMWWGKVRTIVDVPGDGSGCERIEVTDDIMPPLGEWNACYLLMLASSFGILG